MALDDENEPRVGKLVLKDLTPLSVEAIRDYIQSLHDEIARAEDVIAKKEAHRRGADALFGAG